VSKNVDHLVGREDQQEDGEEMRDGFEKQRAIGDPEIRPTQAEYPGALFGNFA
jgi:hypothetical protein